MKKADVLNLTGATSTDILAKIGDGLDKKNRINYDSIWYQ